jgi:hypothetical protein
MPENQDLREQSSFVAGAAQLTMAASHAMNKRPLLVTIISCIFVAAGVVGLAYHATEFNAQHPFQYDVLWICFVRLLAIIAGVFMLRGFNWARWLLVAWVGFHIIIGFLHSPSSGLVHALLFAVVVYFLFRPQGSAYFRRMRAETPPET